MSFSSNRLHCKRTWESVYPFFNWEPTVSFTTAAQAVDAAQGAEGTPTVQVSRINSREKRPVPGTFQSRQARTAMPPATRECMKPYRCVASCARKSFLLQRQPKLQLFNGQKSFARAGRYNRYINSTRSVSTKKVAKKKKSIIPTAFINNVFDAS